MQYAPNYMYLMEQYPNARKDTVLDDGTMYMFDMLRINKKTGGWFILNGMSGREDWLTKLNLSIPTTRDEFEKCLIAIRDGDPNGNGQADEIPLSINKDDINVFAGWFKVLNGFYLDGDTIKFGQLENGYKDYLALMNKWYQEGLLDNEYLLNDSSTLNTKVASGQVGFTYGALVGGLGTWTNMLAENDPNAVITPIPYFPSVDGTPYMNYKVMESGTSQGVAISTNCKNVMMKKE